MADIHAQRKPTFFWQGALILLPVVVMAVFSLMSLRRDAQNAEQDARSRAAQNVQSLARAMRSTVDDDLQRYLNLQFLWLMRIRATATPGNYQEYPNASLKSQIENWERDYPGFNLAGCVAAQGWIWADGREIEPPGAPAAPSPPQWFLELSPAQKALWENLRRAIDAVAGTASVRKDTQAFLESNPSDEAKQAAYALTQPLEQVAQYSGPLATETGLSFGEIACYRMLSKPDARLTDALYRSVYSQIIFHPSIVTPRLLEMAGALTNRTDVYLGPKIAAARLLWDSQARSREWLVPLRGLPGLTNNWSPSAKWAHWAGSPAGGALAFLSAGTSNNVGNNPSGTNVSGHCWEFSFVPRQVVEASFARALKQNQFLVPEYASVEATVQGTPVRLSGQTNHGPAAELLGTAEEHFGQTITSEAADFKLRFYLGSREQMLSAERHRARLFGTLVLASAMAAIVGLLAAYRAFHRQQELNEMKSNFVSSVSHELRAPIASVRLMAENLERGKIPDAPRQGEYFRFIVQECRRLSALIENVLDFSRIEQGRKQYEFEPTDLVALAQTTVKLMEPYAAEKGVRLIAECGVRSAEWNVDGRAIQQALVNLIDNAIKHSPKGESVIVGLSAGGAGVPPAVSGVAPETSGDVVRAPQVETSPGVSMPGDAIRRDADSNGPEARATRRIWIFVTDRGPGIPRAEQEKIFERFYRRGSELRRETQGVGIGLSIVKHIVEAHGGRVLVESEVGKGSRFTIELPVTK